MIEFFLFIFYSLVYLSLIHISPAVRVAPDIRPDALHIVKGFLVDDGLMGILENRDVYKRQNQLHAGICHAPGNPFCIKSLESVLHIAQRYVFTERKACLLYTSVRYN